MTARDPSPDLEQSQPPLILASASPRRADLLRGCGLEFQIIPSHVQEVAHEHLTPHEICQINAYRKARDVAKRFPDFCVLGSDTVVCHGETVYGKPRDLAEAQRMLRELSGEAHEVVTGICLLRLRNHQQRIFAVDTIVWFKELSDQEIEGYLASIDPLDKAGAYAIQENGDLIVEDIHGSFNNVVGLPTERLMQEWQSFFASHASRNDSGCSG